MIDFTISLLKTVFTVFTELVELFIGFLGNSAKRIMRPDREPYQAEWGRSRDLLSRRNKGFVIVAPKLSISEERSYASMLAIGASGSGKTSRTILPTILRTAQLGRSSMLIHDPSSEIFHLCSGYLEKQGYKVKRIVYRDAQQSDLFNPLLRAGSDRSKIAHVAKLLVEAGLGGSVGGDVFWTQSGESVISTLASLIQCVNDKRQHNLSNLKHILQALSGSPKQVDALVARLADDRLYSEYRALVAQSPKVMQNILSTVMASLSWMQDSNLELITSSDTLGNFMDMRKEKVAIIIQSDVMAQSAYRSITSILVNQLLQELMAYIPEKGDRGIYAIIDEAATLSLPWDHEPIT